MRAITKLLFVVSSLMSVSVFAQDGVSAVSGTRGTSVVSARTVGAGANVIHAEIGYPALSGTFLHGASDDFDIGGKLSLGYGGFGGFGFGGVGITAQAVLRFHLSDPSNTISLGLRFLPGIAGLFGYYGGSGAFSVPLQAGFVVGIHPVEKLNIGVGIDVIPTLTFASAVYFSVPILVGGAIEYWITPTIALTADFRVGPYIGAGFGGFGGYGAYFSGNFLVGAAFKL